MLELKKIIVSVCSSAWNPFSQWWHLVKSLQHKKSVNDFHQHQNIYNYDVYRMAQSCSLVIETRATRRIVAWVPGPRRSHENSLKNDIWKASQYESTLRMFQNLFYVFKFISQLTRLLVERARMWNTRQKSFFARKHRECDCGKSERERHMNSCLWSIAIEYIKFSSDTHHIITTATTTETAMLGISRYVISPHLTFSSSCSFVFWLFSSFFLVGTRQVHRIVYCVYMRWRRLRIFWVFWNFDWWQDGHAG